MNQADEVKLASILARMNTLDELRVANTMLKTRWNEVQHAGVKAFVKGDQVSFVSRSGITVHGVVDRINRKTVGVQGENSWDHWRVPPSMLTKVEA